MTSYRQNTRTGWNGLIEEMSHYLAASGKAYQNYAAALHQMGGQ